MSHDKEKALALAKQALDTLLEGVWDEESDPEMVAMLSADIAEQVMLAAAAPTDEKRAEHERNIQHKLAIGVSTAAARYCLTSGKGLASFVLAVRTILSALIIEAL